MRDKQVYAVDANSYFARPGPRVVEGVELLAHLIHPELFKWEGPREAFQWIEFSTTASTTGFAKTFSRKNHLERQRADHFSYPRENKAEELFELRPGVYVRPDCRKLWLLVRTVAERSTTCRRRQGLSLSRLSSRDDCEIGSGCFTPGAG